MSQLFWVYFAFYIFALTMISLTCCRDPSDRPRLASQNARTRHTSSTVISTWQIRIISLRWTLAHRGDQVDQETGLEAGRTLVTQDTIRGLGLHHISSRTLRHCVEHSLFWRKDCPTAQLPAWNWRKLSELIFFSFCFYVVRSLWKRGLPRKFARFVLFCPIKKLSL